MNDRELSDLYHLAEDEGFIVRFILSLSFLTFLMIRVMKDYFFGKQEKKIKNKRVETVFLDTMIMYRGGLGHSYFSNGGKIAFGVGVDTLRPNKTESSAQLWHSDSNHRPVNTTIFEPKG